MLILEFSKPLFEFLKKIYDIYSFYCIPKMGNIISGNYYSYKYLVESIKIHPSQKKLNKILSESEFCNSEYINISGGIVAIHRCYKF